MVALLLRPRLLGYVAGGILVLALGAWGIAASRGGASAAASLVVTDGGLEGEASPGAEVLAPSTTQRLIFVQIVGAVTRPGVYQVPVGSRLFELVEKAGGLARDADSEALALASVLADGAKVEVRRVGEPSPPAPASGGESGSSSAKVSLSTGTAQELDDLPGIGPKTAERIIAYREEHGPFQNVTDLEAISGIGPALVEKLQELVVP